MNIQEDYVSFETAKLLKEKGFNERLLTFYLTDEAKKEGYFQLMAFTDDKIDNNHSDCCYLAPTIQMAMKWLREEYNLFIEIQCYGCEANEKAHFEFSYVISEYVQFDNKICTTVGLEEKKAESQFKSYEEACESAIKYCLENLIK